MRILVTGGCGFIGSHIVDYLVDDGNQVTVIDNLSTGNIKNLNEKASFYNMDITEDISEAFSKARPEVVYHEAAQIDVQKSMKEPAFDAKTNIIGTLNILNCCRNYGVRKIIYASSAAVYGDPEYLPVDESHSIEPISSYGISKHTPEHYIKVFSRLHGLQFTILRYANVYGIRQDPKGEGGVISVFIDKIRRNEPPIIYGDGEQTRDFVYVKDIALANLKALTSGDNQIVNIGTNTGFSVNGLLDMMKRLSGSKLDAVYESERKGDIKHSRLDNGRALSFLGWKPQYTMEQGLAETLTYYLGAAL